jgi:ATP phosphoribosyltransferase regulatory subunit
LRDYRYHSGCVFAAYVAGRSQDVAKGGRYDGIGEVFGRPRPATGFSIDVKTLADIAALPQAQVLRGIYVPPFEAADASLEETVAQLRSAGERVVRGLPGQIPDFDELHCDRQLQRGAQGWEVVLR